MRLKRTINRTVEGKPYYRWTLVVPNDDLKALDWSDQDELESKVERGALVVRRKRQ